MGCKYEEKEKSKNDWVKEEEEDNNTKKAEQKDEIVLVDMIASLGR